MFPKYKTRKQTRRPKTSNFTVLRNLLTLVAKKQDLFDSKGSIHVVQSHYHFSVCMNSDAFVDIQGKRNNDKTVELSIE